MYKNYKNRVEIAESIESLLWPKNTCLAICGNIGYRNLGITKNTLWRTYFALSSDITVYSNISLNNKIFISDIFFKVASLVINISAFASKEVAI